MKPFIITLLVLVGSTLTATAQTTSPTQPTSAKDSLLNINKAAARRFYDAINDGNPDILDQIVDPSFEEHSLSPGQGPGLAGLKESFSQFRKGFPDIKCTVISVIAEGDMVSVLVRMTGTNRGTIYDMSPTGKAFDVMGVDVIRFSNGKAIEHWGYSEEMKMMQQIGWGPQTEQPEKPKKKKRR